MVREVVKPVYCIDDGVLPVDAIAAIRNAFADDSAEPEKTPHDFLAIRKAEEKRKRKRKKRLSNKPL